MLGKLLESAHSEIPPQEKLSFTNPFSVLRTHLCTVVFIAGMALLKRITTLLHSSIQFLIIYSETN